MSALPVDLIVLGQLDVLQCALRPFSVLICAASAAFSFSSVVPLDEMFYFTCCAIYTNARLIRLLSLSVTCSNLAAVHPKLFVLRLLHFGDSVSR